MTCAKTVHNSSSQRGENVKLCCALDALDLLLVHVVITLVVAVKVPTCEHLILLMMGKLNSR